MVFWKRKIEKVAGKVAFGAEKQRVLKPLLQRFGKPIQKPVIQKRTEITVGFGMQGPGFVEKKKPYLDKADVILVEVRPETVDRLKAGEDPEALAHENTRHPEYAAELFNLLRQEIREGKIVIGMEYGTKEIEKKMQEKNKLINEDNIEGAAKAMAECDEMRKQKRSEWLLEHLPLFEGKKIYVDAGSMDTPLYHRLREMFREKENKGEMKITREHLAKGMYEAPQILEKYLPFEQIERMYTFKKGKFTEADRKRIAELVEQDKLFFNEMMHLGGKYAAQGMTKERATEKAYFEVLRRLRKEGLKKEL